MEETKTEKEELEEIVIGFDFECAGGIPNDNGFTQLGASAHELKTGKKIAGFNEYASMKGYVWEERCVKEFWEKNPERYAETLKKTADSKHTCAEVVAMFIEWAREVSKGRKCVIISDNMIYDGSLVKYYSGVDVIYLLGNGYTCFFETASVYFGMYANHKRQKLDFDSKDGLSSKQLALDAINANREVKLEYPTNGVKHDHRPENDAENMVNKWCFIMNNL